MVLLSSLLFILCCLLVLTITKIVQILSYTSSDFICSSEENPTFLSVCNLYLVPYGKIPLGRPFECHFLCFERQTFLFWETVTSPGIYLTFILAHYTSTFYRNNLVSYLISTNMYCKFQQTILFFVLLNDLTQSNQQEVKFQTFLNTT